MKKRNEFLQDAIGQIDDEFIRDAKKPAMRKAHGWQRYIAIAACLALILATVPIGMLISSRVTDGGPSDGEYETAGSTESTNGSEAVEPEDTVVNGGDADTSTKDNENYESNYGGNTDSSLESEPIESSSNEEYDSYDDASNAEESIDPSDGTEKGITVSSGEDRISPLSYLLWSEKYDEDSGRWVSSDATGASVDVIARLNAENVPTLICDGDTDVQIGEGGIFRDLTVYDVWLCKFDLPESRVEALQDLPEGEWYVVISVVWQGREIDGGTEETCCEYLFRLIKDAS